MAYINVDEVYILDNTGLQVDQTTDLPFKDAGLTESQQAQARKNIAAGGTNPNLLDNPWFTVNQRSAATIPVGGYGVDRWKGGSAGAVTVASGGLQFVGRGNAYQIPPSDFWDSMIGKTVTASLLFSDGTVQGGSGVIGSGITEFGTYNGVRIFKSSSNNFNLESDSDANCIVRAVKLELGSVSTLANDAPPRYKSELDDCEYYCRTIEGSNYTAFGMATASNVVRVVLPFTMRAKPTPSISGAAYLTGTGGTLTVSSITVNGWNDTSVELLCNVTGATANTPYLLWLAANAKIILSADL